MRRVLWLLCLLACVALVLNCSPRRSGGGGGGSDDDDSASADDDDAADDDDDATSGYACGWPVWSGADSLGSPEFGGSAAVGDQVPRLFGVDQCGEEVDLYHLGGGPPIILSTYAMWSGADRSMASWLAGVDSDLNTYNAVRDAVEDGELRWVSLLWQDNQGASADAGDALDWAEDYPTDNVPVLSGSEIEFFADWLGASFVPYLVLVDGNMEVLSLPDEGDLYQSLDAALNYLDAQ